MNYIYPAIYCKLFWSLSKIIFCVLLCTQSIFMELEFWLLVKVISPPNLLGSKSSSNKLEKNFFLLAPEFSINQLHLAWQIQRNYTSYVSSDKQKYPWHNIAQSFTISSNCLIFKVGKSVFFSFSAMLDIPFRVC